jgi:hypothetical protein
MRAFPVRRPGVRYRTVIDEGPAVAGKVDGFLRKVRSGRAGPERTTKAHAGAGTLHMRWSARTGLSWQAGLAQTALFITWLRPVPVQVAGADAAHLRGGPEPARLHRADQPGVPGQEPGWPPSRHWPPLGQEPATRSARASQQTSWPGWLPDLRRRVLRRTRAADQGPGRTLSGTRAEAIGIAGTRQLQADDRPGPGRRPPLGCASALAFADTRSRGGAGRDAR